MCYSRHPKRPGMRSPGPELRSLSWRRNTASSGGGWPNVPMWQADQIDPAMKPYQSTPTGEPNARRLIQSNPSARAELLVYGSLGFAAVVAVITALAVMFDFANNLDRVALRLSPAPTAIAVTESAGCDQNSLTNITGTGRGLPASNRSGEANISPVESTIRRKSDLPKG